MRRPAQEACVDHPIRVVLVGLSPLLRAVVQDIVANQTDMAVVAAADRFENLRAGDGTRGDVFLVAIDSEPPAELYEQVLATPGPRRVIGISSDGRRTSLFELRPTVSPLGELSASELLEVIRGGSPLGV
jgi:chemotaxis response regulator CheB